MMIEKMNRGGARKSTWLKDVLDIAWYYLMFILIQLVCILLLGIMADGANKVIVASAISSVLTTLLFVRLKWSPVTRDYLKSKPVLPILWVVLLALGTVVPSMALNDFLGLEMPEEEATLLAEMMKKPAGYAAIGVLIPIAEEIVFRGAILRKLLEKMGDGKHWLAILCSALLFGIAHGNSAQFVHAVLAGMLLGWLYYRTKSVVPGIAFHLVNNTVTYIVVNILPPGMEDITISQLAGGSTTHMILYIVFSLCIFIPALFQLNRLLKRVGEK